MKNKSSMFNTCECIKTYNLPSKRHYDVRKECIKDMKIVIIKINEFAQKDNTLDLDALKHRIKVKRQIEAQIPELTSEKRRPVEERFFDVREK